MSSTLAERFELLGELGRGGMGVVHRARERATGREVALKVLAPGAHDPELVLRARREAEALAAVRHPGIVAVHAAGESEGRPWIACELVDQSSSNSTPLSERPTRGPGKSLGWWRMSSTGVNRSTYSSFQSSSVPIISTPCFTP